MKKIVSVFVLMLLISSVVSVMANDNQPPNKPTISGPRNGKKNVVLEYTFMSIDPEGDDIFFHISWGCCGSGDFHSYGPFSSGEEVKLSHSYSEEDDYIIQAYAEDTNEGESDMATFEISIPKYKDISSQGLFEAELGRKGSDEPIVFLEGNYESRGRFVIFYGVAKSGDKEGRFRGGFRGNRFILLIPVRDRSLILIGRCSFDEELGSFSGVWIGRGNPLRGWIEGNLIP